MSLATLSDCRSWLGLTTATADDTFILSVVMASTDRMFADFLGFSPAQATRSEYYPARVNLTQRDALVDGYERSGTNKVVPIDRYRNERRVIALRHVPVRSVTAVYENPDAWLSDPPDFGSQYLLTSGADYSLDLAEDGFSRTGFLVRSTGPWSVAERCVKVTYVGGYTADELANDYGVLRHAYLVQVQMAYNSTLLHRKGAGLGTMPGILTSESLGDWSASYDALTSQRLYGYQARMAPAVAQMLENYMNYSNFL